MRFTYRARINKIDLLKVNFDMTLPDGKVIKNQELSAPFDNIPELLEGSVYTLECYIDDATHEKSYYFSK